MGVTSGKGGSNKIPLSETIERKDSMGSFRSARGSFPAVPLQEELTVVEKAKEVKETEDFGGEKQREEGKMEEEDEKANQG